MIDFTAIGNAVYEGAVEECEAREHDGHYVGNGHHMAQRIQAFVDAALRRRPFHTLIETRRYPDIQNAQALLKDVLHQGKGEGDALHRLTVHVLNTLRSTYERRVGAAREAAVDLEAEYRMAMLSQTIETALAAVGATFLLALLEDTPSVVAPVASVKVSEYNEFGDPSGMP